MKLLYNYTNGTHIIYPHYETEQEIFKDIIQYHNGNKQDFFAVFDIDHWTKDDYIEFDSLHPEDQGGLLEKLSALLVNYPDDYTGE